MKDLIFVGTSLTDINKLPEYDRREVGRDLNRLQHGLASPHWKPAPTVGEGAIEIRLRIDVGTYSAFYITEIGDEIYVLHAFTKTTQKTPHADIYVGQKRLMAIYQLRTQHHHQRSRPGYIMPDTADPVTGRNVALKRSSGNVFEDFGFLEDEALVLKVRSELMISIERMIRDQQLTPDELEGILKVAPTRISDLRRGKIDKFSLDMLVTFTARMHCKIKFLLTH